MGKVWKERGREIKKDKRSLRDEESEISKKY